MPKRRIFFRFSFSSDLLKLIQFDAKRHMRARSVVEATRFQGKCVRNKSVVCKQRAPFRNVVDKFNTIWHPALEWEGNFSLSQKKYHLL